MIKYRITQEQKDWAWAYVNTNKIANRGDSTDGTLAWQYAGMIGEAVFADLFGYPRPKAGGFDNGVDFVVQGVAIDVKAMGRKWYARDYHVNNIFASQVEGDRYKNDVYLFASINKATSELEFTGWLKKHYVVNKVEGVEYVTKGTPRHRADGTMKPARGNSYEVSNKILNEFGTPEAFLMDMGGLGHPSNF
jgi:hypothetical protein